MLRRALFFGLLVLLGCGSSPAFSRVHFRRHREHKVVDASLTSKSSHHHRRWRRIFWNPVFRPSHDSLLKQNAEIDRLELPRIQDDAELEQLKLEGKLLPIIPNEGLRVDPRLDPDRRYCRPWTRLFVEDLAAAYHEQFPRDQIQVNSAVRTVVVQKKLRRHNRNAAPAEGEIASSHLAGVTVDLQRRGMSKAQIHWVEDYLIPMKAAGLVEPEEERRQWVFHIMVSDRYSEWRDESQVARTNELRPSEVSSDNPTPAAIVELPGADPAGSLMAPRPVVPGAVAPEPEPVTPEASPEKAKPESDVPASSTNPR